MICKVENEYLREITDIARSAYGAECGHNSSLCKNCIEELAACIAEEVNAGNGLVYIEENRVLGYFLYWKYMKEDGSLCCSTPFWGYGAIGEGRDKVISRLFLQAASELCKGQVVHYTIKLYAHDLEIQRLFSFLQFGILCEEGIRDTKDRIWVPVEVS